MAANAAAADRSPGSVAKLSIGQVLQRISAEFPDVTPSKLRFLEDQGLLHPVRSASGYRKFSDADVERVRTILSMQRDLYLPLKVIGEYLDELDEGRNPPMPGSQAPHVASILAPGAELDRRGLVARAGASTALAEQAVTAGLIAAAGPYHEGDLAMLRALVELEEHGIEPRHLRAFRTAAQHELGLIEQALGPARRRRDAQGTMREIADQLGAVRRQLVLAALREGDRPARGRR
ncbi:putative HTH-type transcriptional regulator [Pseudoclavibacter triregionum]|nr:putative HTH-type transcriptional regulator [Pseudoclavibacter triregionum]